MQGRRAFMAIEGREQIRCIHKVADRVEMVKIYTHLIRPFKGHMQSLCRLKPSDLEQTPLHTAPSLVHLRSAVFIFHSV